MKTIRLLPLADIYPYQHMSETERINQLLNTTRQVLQSIWLATYASPDVRSGGLIAGKISDVTTGLCVRSRL